MEHDAIVIGSDRVACATAIEAAVRGLDVVVIDDRRNGTGDPDRGASILKSKIREALSHQLAIRKLTAHGSSSTTEPLLPGRVIQAIRGRVSERYFPALRGKLAEFGIRELSGSARFVSPHRIHLEPHGIVTAPIVVIAVGSRPRHPERFEFDHQVICDCRTVTRFDRPPRHLLIVGAEAAGLELAGIFHALGSNVTLLDRREQALRYVDREIRKVLHARMRALGIDLILGEDLDEIRICDPEAAPHAEVRLASGRVETCDRVLIEAGRTANTEKLGLDEAGIEIDESGFVIVDEHQQTSQAGVYAVGDASGNLGPVDLRQPRVAVQHALGEEIEPVEPTPLIIHTTPPISMLGWTEEMCQRLDLPHAVGTARYGDLPSLQMSERGEGVLKLVITRGDRRIAGIHAIGEGAHELAQVGAALASTGAGIDELASCPFAPDTLFQAFLFAAEDALRHLAMG